MDANRWAELRGAVVLREAAEGSSRERREDAGQGSITRLPQGRNGCNHDCAERDPDIGLALISEPAARWRRNRAADHVSVRGLGGTGHASTDFRALAG